jgi:hypothetical protein
MGYMMFPNCFKDILGVNFAQTDIYTCARSNSPWKTPSIAMKQWQDP